MAGGWASAAVTGGLVRRSPAWAAAATTASLVRFESWSDRARAVVMDFDPVVTAVASQPFQLIGPNDSTLWHHVPDDVGKQRPRQAMNDLGIPADAGWGELASNTEHVLWQVSKRIAASAAPRSL
jgi:hypothetical protein